MSTPPDSASEVEAELRVLAALVLGLIAGTIERDALPGAAQRASTVTAALRKNGAETLAHLAHSIERGFLYLHDGELDPGQALPILASCIDTVARHTGIRQIRSSSVIEAARYELETLFPIPGREPKTVSGGPDVRLQRLKRRDS